MASAAGTYRAYLVGYSVALTKGNSSVPADDGEACAYALGLRAGSEAKDPAPRSEVERLVAALLK